MLDIDSDSAFRSLLLVFGRCCFFFNDFVMLNGQIVIKKHYKKIYIYISL